MKKKFIIVGLIMVMCLGIFSGCEPNFEKEIYTDRIFVFIRQDYKEKFLSQEFTSEDFGMDNIAKIDYYHWYDELSSESGYPTDGGGFLIVYLNTSGKSRIEKAKAHIEKLEFVREVSFLGRLPSDESEGR